jgi:hypothetical protein
MKTTIYWTMQHSRRTVYELRFRATCWWLRQQVEFLEWQVRLAALMPPVQSDPTPTSAKPGDQYAVHPV